MSNVRGGEAAFSEAYASLNAAQKEAVDTIEGPVLVVAGPGTGKTQVLTLRIANILRQTDVQPENILALTFTESGAKAMRERLRRYIGELAYRVPIYTFHGFAGQLIAQYPDAYPNIIGGRPASDLEKIELIETILSGGDFSLLRPAGNPQYYVTAILRMLSTLKQEYVDVAALNKLISAQETQLAATPKLHEKGAHKGKVRGEYTTLEKTIAKNRELALVYQQYQALLSERGWFDFEDMLVGTVAALREQEDMLRDVQEMYQYVLADEHQDVNGTQNALLELLVSFHDNPNIFAVGDEKQAIYRFQGASLENFLKFTDVFPSTTTITLTESYRSGQAILDCAHSLVAVEEGPLKDLRVPLTAANALDATVTSRTFTHQAVEDQWLADTVATTVDAGTPSNEVAVIVRTNREVEHVAGLLRSAGHAVAASADGDILAHPITEQVHQLLLATTEPANSEALARVFAAPYWGITRADQMRVLAAQRYDRPLTTLIAEPKLLREAGVADVDSVTRLSGVLDAAQAASVSEPPHRVLQQLLNESGLLAHIEQQNPLEGVRVIRRLYDEVEALVRHDNVADVASVARMLTLHRSYGVPLNAPYINATAEAVQVMTAHKSKGLEFSVVLVPYLTDRTWGGARRPEHFKLPLVRTEISEAVEPLDDERRLLYVAMTRAKETLHLSVSETSSSGKAASVSRILTELAANTYDDVDTTALAESFDLTAAIATTQPAPTVDTALVTSLFLERGFSATSFNNYLESPWKYLAKNLLRLPEVQGLPLLYGTAVHNVLERTTRQHAQTGELATVDELAAWLHTELHRLPLSAKEYTQLHERALAALAVYREHLATALPKQTQEEYKLSVALSTGLEACPEVVLTGKLDRFDLSEDGTLRRVVDYKTGKPKSRNAIEGKTQSDDGGYKRQLVFYALLLELQGQPERQTREMVLSFVEPTAKGEIREEIFSITDEEIAELKAQIIAAAGLLTDGSWTREPCDPESTPYRDLFTG